MIHHACSAETTEISDCRSRIIQAAREVFVEEGYRASIDRVAAKAGVARQTLYNHFECKSDLFAEVIRWTTAALLISLEGEGKTLRERLLGFGQVYRDRVLGSDGLGYFRILVAESQRFPELVATVYRTGPIETAKHVTAIFKAAMDRGELRPTNPDFATRMFLSMLVGSDRTHYLFSGEPPPQPDPELVTQIVDTFLRAFAAEASNEPTNSRTCA